MNKTWQIYFNVVLGCIGGILGWLIVGLIPMDDWNVHLSNVLSGIGVGLFIGGAIGMMEGLLVKRSILRTFLGLIGGTIAGAISGGLGLGLGGLAFVFIGNLETSFLTDPLFGSFTLGGFLARIIGWVSFGAFLGLGLGMLSLKIKRIGFSLLGGMIAGLIGGIIYDLLTQVFLQNSGQAQVFLSAVGIVLIGACLGGIIAATVELAKDAMIKVIAGKRTNTEISVIGRTTIGSSDACDVYIPDEGVKKNHAQVLKEAKGFIIQNTADNQPVLVNQTTLATGATLPLKDGDLITIGAAKMQFKLR
jgi:hypothetical protein